MTMALCLGTVPYGPVRCPGLSARILKSHVRGKPVLSTAEGLSRVVREGGRGREAPAHHNLGGAFSTVESVKASVGGRLSNPTSRLGYSTTAHTFNGSPCLFVSKSGSRRVL
jgi:hypothetical protein